MEPLVKTFGEIAYKWPLSDSKKLHIKSSVISNTGVCATVFKEGALYCNLPHGILNFLAKNLNIKGYRIDERPFRERLIPKLIQAIEKGSEKLEKPFWDVYGIACIHYLRSKMRELDQTLLNEKPDSETNDALSFFQQLALNTPKYSVPKEHILMFHEFWRFDLQDNLSELIFSKEFNSLAITNKIIDDLKKNDLKPLKEEVESLRRAIGSIEESIENIPNVEQMNQLVKKVSSTVEEVKIELENRFSSIPAKIGIQVGTLSKSFEELRTLVSKNPSVMDLQKRSEEIEKKLEKIEKRLVNSADFIPRQANSINHSTSITSSEMSNEISFMAELFEDLKVIPEYGWLSESLLVINHCFFSLDSPVILKDSTLLEKWIEKQTRLKKESVFPEPTWLTGDELTKKISGKTSGDVVLIKNFEIGIYEAYAVPVVCRFLEEKEPPKIVLVSGDYSENLPSFEILKISPILGLQQIDWIKGKRFELKVNIKKDLSKAFKSELALKKNLLPVRDFSATVSAYAKSVGVDFPPRLISIGANFASHLNYYFGEIDALAISIEIVLKPYLLEKFGREMCSSFSRSINSHVGNKLEVT